MRTVLFASCYLNGLDSSGSSRLDRTIKWLRYYWPLRHELGFQKIILYDNHSDIGLLGHVSKWSPALTYLSSADLPHESGGKIEIFTANKKLHHGVGLEYPHCWRSLWFIRELLGLYDKVIAIDTDGFVLSPKLAKWVNDEEEWATLWCPTWGFPDSSIQVIGPKGRQDFLDFTKGKWEDQLGKKMELTLPFERVSVDFVADRFGENRIPVNLNTDYYGQCPTDIEMVYRGDICDVVLPPL